MSRINSNSINRIEISILDNVYTVYTKNGIFIYPIRRLPKCVREYLKKSEKLWELVLITKDEKTIIKNAYQIIND